MARKRNIWKVVSIIFIALFVLIIASAFIRNYLFRPTFTTPNQAQIDMAKDLAINDITQRGENPNDYTLGVSTRIKSPPGQPNRNVIEVSLYNSTIKHTYIIDTDLQSILMHSRTESLGYINFSDDRMLHAENPGPFGLIR